MTTVLTEALCRDAAALLERYRTGTWVPAPEDHELAENLARSRWDGPCFRATLQGAAAVRSGRLIDVLEPAVDVLDPAPCVTTGSRGAP